MIERLLIRRELDPQVHIAHNSEIRGWVTRRSLAASSCVRRRAPLRRSSFGAATASPLSPRRAGPAPLLGGLRTLVREGPRCAAPGALPFLAHQRHQLAAAKAVAVGRPASAVADATPCQRCRMTASVYRRALDRRLFAIDLPPSTGSNQFDGARSAESPTVERWANHVVRRPAASEQPPKLLDGESGSWTMPPMVKAFTGLWRGIVRMRWPSVMTVCLPCRAMRKRPSPAPAPRRGG